MGIMGEQTPNKVRFEEAKKLIPEVRHE